MQLSMFQEVVPIPSCEYLVCEKYPTARAVADEYLREVRLWKSRNPQKDFHTIISPEWVAYVEANL